MSLTDQIELHEVNSIVTILYDDPALGIEKERLSGALGIPPNIIYDYEQRSLFDTFRFLTLMLNKWISKEGRVATRERLVNVLKKEGFANVSEKLEILFERERGNIATSTDTVWFDMREDVHGFTGRQEILNNLHKALTEQRNKRITVITTLHGLGGIGKTTLAVRYAWLYHENSFYRNVVWINAETKNDSFNRLADELGISTLDKRSKQLDLRQIVCKIYGHFNGKGNTLFILDNATNYESIEECLPPPKTPGLTSPFVLLTSRHSNWGDSVTEITEIPLDVFSEDESVEFFTKYLKLDTESEILFARKIAVMLDNLPLAVRQAGAYIKMQARLGLKTMEENLEEYTTNFRHKSEELLGFEHWAVTKDRNYEKTTLLTWDLTLEIIRKQNDYTEVIMHIIAYLNPDNIPTQLFESLIPEPKDDTWFERFRSLCGCKVEPNLPQSTGFNIMSAIKLLADYSMINPQTSFRRGMISVHRLVQRVVRIQIERAHEFSKLGDCVQLFETHFQSNNSSYEAEILIHAETLSDNIKESNLSDRYDSFIQLVKRKLENLLEKQISLFENLIDQKKYDQAFEINRNPQHFGPNISVYNTYLRGTFEILLELVESLIKSEGLEVLIKVHTELNQPYFLALYSTDLIESDLWVHYGHLLSKCIIVSGRSQKGNQKRWEIINGNLKRQLAECFAVALVHLQRVVDLLVLLQMTKDFISRLGGASDNESQKLGIMRGFICVMEEHAKQNILAFVDFSLVSVMELIEYVHPESRRHVLDEFVSVVTDIFIYSTSRLDFLMLLEFANSILLCFKRYREYNSVPIILREVILRMDSTSENKSEHTVLEIQIMARIIYEIVTDENYNQDVDLWSQLLHIAKLNYDAIRIHSIVETGSLEAELILHCYVALDADISQILEFSTNYLADFMYSGSALTSESFRRIHDMILWSTRLLQEGTRGLDKGNEKYTLLVQESIEISQVYFETILVLESKRLRYSYLALSALRIRINCILSLEKISRSPEFHALRETLNNPALISSELETLLSTGVGVIDPSRFVPDVLEYLKLIETEIIILKAIPSILELAIVDIMRLIAEIMNLSGDLEGALGKLRIARNLLNNSLAGNLESTKKNKHVTFKIKSIQTAMKNVRV